MAATAQPQIAGVRPVVAFSTEADRVQRMLTHFEESGEPPSIATFREPHEQEHDLEPMLDWSLIAQPDPGVEFDQRVS